MPYIFAYGTLQNEEMQIAATGRAFENPVRAFVRGEVFDRHINGDAYRFLHPDGIGRLVSGVVFEVTDTEMVLIDRYETGAYLRRELDLFDREGKPHAIPRAYAYTAPQKEVERVRAIRQRGRS